MGNHRANFQNDIYPFPVNKIFFCLQINQPYNFIIQGLLRKLIPFFFIQLDVDQKCGFPLVDISFLERNSSSVPQHITQELLKEGQRAYKQVKHLFTNTQKNIKLSECLLYNSTQQSQSRSLYRDGGDAYRGLLNKSCLCKVQRSGKHSKNSI